MYKKISHIKNYTRGGQITLHNIRMFIQITNKVALVSAVLFLLVTCLVAWMSISKYEWYVSQEYAWSTFVPYFKHSGIHV